jgi:hypothetical protein
MFIDSRMWMAVSRISQRKNHMRSRHTAAPNQHTAPQPPRTKGLVQALLLCRVKARAGSQWLGCHGLREAPYAWKRTWWVLMVQSDVG